MMRAVSVSVTVLPDASPVCRERFEVSVCARACCDISRLGGGGGVREGLAFYSRLSNVRFVSWVVSPGWREVGHQRFRKMFSDGARRHSPMPTGPTPVPVL